MTRLLRAVRPASLATLALALTLLLVAACSTPPHSTAQRPTGNTEIAEPTPAPSQTADLAPAQPANESQPAHNKMVPLSEPPPAPVASLDITKSSPDQPAISNEIPISSAPQKPPKPPINDDPHQLMGLTPDAVNRLLGPPSLLRTESPAKVWQYTAEDCVLDIYLYAEEQTPDRSRVTYYEIRRPDTAKSGARACFAEIITSRMNARDRNSQQ
jgi:hypothetical protein